MLRLCTFHDHSMVGLHLFTKQCSSVFFYLFYIFLSFKFVSSEFWTVIINSFSKSSQTCHFLKSHPALFHYKLMACSFCILSVPFLSVIKKNTRSNLKHIAIYKPQVSVSQLDVKVWYHRATCLGSRCSSSCWHTCSWRGGGVDASLAGELGSAMARLLNRSVWQQQARAARVCTAVRVRREGKAHTSGILRVPWTNVFSRLPMYIFVITQIVSAQGCSVEPHGLQVSCSHCPFTCSSQNWYEFAYCTDVAILMFWFGQDMCCLSLTHIHTT